MMTDKETTESKVTTTISNLFEKHKLARRIILLYLSSVLFYMIYAMTGMMLAAGEINPEYSSIVKLFIGMYTTVVAFYFSFSGYIELKKKGVATDEENKN